MYLKKIETQGFKSFANKMVLEFRPGIMGIVGPNGSGKSNVADAVRWVLGEQSAKQLRGSNMQDVIFAGTENRKPQGYAYVALTIDNTDHMLAVDYDEVTVARRVYRSGESEYRINGNLCRLKDILELFYDTGVGKEGYSIIGQGQIDRILSGKPEDRRELFDEAAGIVKFKKRKHMTLKKLETEEGNLLRVTDILKELERRVGPLEKESEKARQYLKYREELKAADVQAFRMEISEYEKKTAEHQERLGIVQSDVEKTRAEADQIRARYEELSGELEVLEESLEQDRKDRGDASVRREALEGQMALLEEKIRASRTDEEKVRLRIELLEQQREEKKEDLARLLSQIDAADEENREKSDRLALEEQECNTHQEEIRRLETEVAALQQEQLQAMEEKAKVSADLERTVTMLGQFSERSAVLLRRLSGSEEEQEGLDQRLLDQRTRLERRGQDQKQLRSQQAETERSLQKLLEEQRRNNHAMAGENQNYMSVKSHRESLMRLTERYEGYNNSIRKVMELKDDNAGILGVVADLFHSEEKYETALEIALGGRIQNIVTDTEQTAKDLIEYLKKGHLGRATFLPLSGIQAREGFPRPEACKERGAIGVASELVRVEPRFRPVANYLLGRTLIVDNIDHALMIARKYRYSLNIVTLEGDQLTPGGAMTGGSTRNNNASFLGRRREIEEMKQQQNQIQGRLDVLRKEARKLEDAIGEKQHLLEMLKTREHETDLEIRTLSMELAALEEQKEHLTEGISNWEAEQEDLLGQIRQWNQLKSEGEQMLKTIADRISDCEDRVDDDLLTLEGVKDERDRCLRRIEQFRRGQAAHEEAQNFRRENSDRLQQEIGNLMEESNALQEGISGGDARRLENEARKEEIRALIEECGRRIAVAEEKIASQNLRKEALTAEQRTSMDARDELTDRLTLLEKDVVRIQNALERLEEQESKLIDYIWEEYQMTASEAEQAAEDAEPVTLTEARRRVSRARTAIRELGPVNVNSIEEFREVGERYTFLKAQHEDLVRGADQLRGIIRELDESMRRQFREKFAQIQVEFDRVFQELFGGGKGRLELGEADDILDAGILINAQPPGKKLQNMMQLSGGEKALSAIALLFAIQNLKPSPFCLLDEIEAALDEPNVDRYAAYLNKLKGHTQFIVITHRRGTMEMADRLYGITMQEKGVSALVSVDLTDTTLIS